MASSLEKQPTKEIWERCQVTDLACRRHWQAAKNESSMSLHVVCARIDACVKWYLVSALIGIHIIKQFPTDLGIILLLFLMDPYRYHYRR